MKIATEISCYKDLQLYHTAGSDLTVAAGAPLLISDTVGLLR